MDQKRQEVHVSVIWRYFIYSVLVGRCSRSLNSPPLLMIQGLFKSIFTIWVTEVHRLGLSFSIDKKRWSGQGWGTVMQRRSLNGHFDRRWLSLDKIHLNYCIKLGGAGMSIRESHVTGKANHLDIKTPGAMACWLPFLPLTQYPHYLSFICTLMKCLLHILILEMLCPPSKSFPWPFPKGMLPNET